MQQNTTEARPRFNTEGRVPTWYRDTLTPEKKVGHVFGDRRIHIGSGEDCFVTMDELNILTEDEVCTS